MQRISTTIFYFLKQQIWKIFLLFLLLIIFCAFWNERELFLFNTFFPIPFKKEEKSTTKGFILHCGFDYWGAYVMKEFYFLFSYLHTQYKWECVSKDNITELWKLANSSSSSSGKTRIHANQVPDVIIFEHHTISLVYSNPQVVNNLRKSYPKLKFAYFCDDLHHSCGRNKDLARLFRSIDTFISPYAYRIKSFYQKHLKNLTEEEYPEFLWIPHSASPPFTDNQTILFRSKPQTKLFLSGAIEEYYPYRQWLKRNEKLVKNLVIYPHPGYDTNMPKNQSEVFALNINKYLASFTSGSILQYVVAKVFEIPATGSLLMLNSHLDELMMALGFFPQVHYYNYSALDPLADIQWVFQLGNRAKVDKMRWNGMMEARKNHRTSLRAKAIYDYFHSGIVTYKIPTRYRQALCPNILNKKNCKEMFF